jgi:hypothetical protein
MVLRKKIVVVCGIIYGILAVTIFFGLKLFSQKNFSTKKLNEILTGNSKFVDKTTDVCKYQLLGEPKVDKNYVKVNLWCNNGSKASSTLALVAFEDKTVGGVIKEYARIAGFDEKIINEEPWLCRLNSVKIDENIMYSLIEPASNIECFEKNEL